MEFHTVHYSNPATVTGLTQAKGDLVCGGTSGLVRLPVGSNGQILVADSSTDSGFAYTTHTAAEHAASHYSGGSDEIEADQLAVTFSPTAYTATTSDIGGHLDGIHSALGTINSSITSVENEVDALAAGVKTTTMAVLTTPTIDLTADTPTDVQTVSVPSGYTFFPESIKFYQLTTGTVDAVVTVGDASGSNDAIYGTYSQGAHTGGTMRTVSGLPSVAAATGGGLKVTVTTADANAGTCQVLFVGVLVANA